MDLAQVMEQKSFVVVGDTLNEEKYAAKIKRAMLEHGYQVQCGSWRRAPARRRTA